MTTIIGVEHEDGCVLLADSRTTDSEGRIYSHSSITKLNKRGDFIIGGSGEASPCDIAQHLWIPPKLTARDRKDLQHFMIVKAMPSLRKCLSSNGYNFDERSNDGSRFQMLIAVNGVIFDVDQDLVASRNEPGIYAVGSGSSYALGALHAGADIMGAMEIAASLTVYTAPPYLQLEQSKVY
jgi:ATP-dependent protease HslVU (ClpYQ) peptidase subunit